MHTPLQYYLSYLLISFLYVYTDLTPERKELRVAHKNVIFSVCRCRFRFVVLIRSIILLSENTRWWWHWGWIMHGNEWTWHKHSIFFYYSFSSLLPCATHIIDFFCWWQVWQVCEKAQKKSESKSFIHFHTNILIIETGESNPYI